MFNLAYILSAVLAGIGFATPGLPGLLMMLIGTGTGIYLLNHTPEN